MRSPVRGLLAALSAALLAACGGDAPENVPVRRLAVPDVGTAVHRDGVRALAVPDPLDVAETAGGGAVRLVRGGGGELWIETELARSDWTRGTLPGAWVAPMRVGGIGRITSEEPVQRLASEGRSFVDLYSRPATAGVPEPETFHATADTLTLFLAEGEEPPAHARLGVRVSHARTEADGTLRVTGRRFGGEGFSVWPDERFTWTGPVPERATLSFAFTAERAARGAEAHVRFRVLHDGREVLAARSEVPADGLVERYEVELDGGGSSTLGFEVEGNFAYTAFLEPVLVDRDAALSERPDVVVFLADTFRADLLRAYGGEHALTPALERFAERAVLFANAWSTATYTLPAHASLFSGLYPREVGASGIAHAVPEDMETIAERLARHGYRTGAITDSGLVSQVYALEQGFQWFDELHRDLDSTLARARAFLDADDGRPVLLFVQTYYTHAPYEVSETTRASHGALLGLDFTDTNDELFAALGPDLASVTLDTPAAREALDKLRRLYLGTAVDLDRAFERFVADLDRRGMLERGYLVFTSDHGEAFGEHGELGHRGRVHEAQTRVPLLVGGGGLRPRVEARAASLIDLAPTLALLTDAPADPAWRGAALFELPDERALFTFQCRADRADSTLGAIEWPRKVWASEDPESIRAGRVLAAYDLERDPDENADLGAAEWPAETLRRLAEELLPLLEERAAAPRAAPDPAHLEQLRALGYVGD